ncbi:hypothetical protein KY290_024710 [Solanum tuberosum]|uniref:Uncharacterized protein n=1 Tax=Solanum tuberosum TaxID=4113 RepID=A0ABQ7URG7_SOLTU|nr:hypothetical protein KY284_023564 [Solanum tuberosum]KAH0754440.1 hypothetical protein KY290_024710 [Solanum tuberosum]
MGFKYFRFLNVWIEHPNFKHVVQDAWNVDIQGNSMWKLHQKLKPLSRTLSQWSKTTIGNVPDKVKEWEEKLQHLENEYIDNDRDDAIFEMHHVDE